MSDESLGLLREMRDELRGIRQAIQKITPLHVINEDEANFVRTVALTVGERLFSSAELARHAALPSSLELCSAILAACGSLNPRRIGKALRTVEGRDFAGVVIQRRGEDSQGIIWRAEFVDSKLTKPIPLIEGVGMHSENVATLRGAAR